MKTHNAIADLLPFYAAGRLEKTDRAEVEAHLEACAECRSDLMVWADLSGEIRAADRAVSPPPDLADRALAQARLFPRPVEGGLGAAFRRAGALLRAQASLVQRELWPASAVVMLIGAAMALVSKHVEAVYFIAPLIAAASLSALFGPEHDPAYELIMSTPTSAWRVMLARLSLVSAYNLLLALAASLAMLAILPVDLLGNVILGWLGPMAFLSALALLLSIWLGTGNAVSLTYGLWILHYLPYQTITALGGSPIWEGALQAYQSFWGNPLLLVSLSIPLIGLALWSAGRPIFRLNGAGG